MSNRTYICVACRTTARRQARYGVNAVSVRCPECQTEMWSLCWRWRIPRKTDDFGWRELAEKVSSDSQARAGFEDTLTRKIEDLVRQVGEAERILDREKRDGKIRVLRKRIQQFERARSIFRDEQNQAQQVAAPKRSSTPVPKSEISVRGSEHSNVSNKL